MLIVTITKVHFTANVLLDSEVMVLIVKMKMNAKKLVVLVMNFVMIRLFASIYLAVFAVNVSLDMLVMVGIVKI